MLWGLLFNLLNKGIFKFNGIYCYWKLHNQICKQKITHLSYISDWRSKLVWENSLHLWGWKGPSRQACYCIHWKMVSLWKSRPGNLAFSIIKTHSLAKKDHSFTFFSKRFIEQLLVKVKTTFNYLNMIFLFEFGIITSIISCYNFFCFLHYSKLSLWQFWCQKEML